METNEGVAHLQAAAREMVAAARSFLDALEDMVNDDDRMTTVVSGVTDALREATDAVAGIGRRVVPTREPPRDGTTADDAEPDGRVERIHLD
jgi:hypothetical protein